MNLLCLNCLSKGLARTSNIAEGWHNAFSTTNPTKRPCLADFVNALILDEDIARTRIASCEAHLPPPPPNPKWAKRNQRILNAVNAYRAEQEENKKKPDSDDSDLEDDLNSSTEREARQWKESPELKLLMAVAHNTKV